MWVKGKHGQLQPPKGGQLWTLAEMHAIEASVGKSAVTVDLVRKGLRAAGLQLRCSSQQLYNYMNRRPKSQQQAKPKVTNITVADLAAAASAYTLPPAQWDAEDPWKSTVVDQLIILPDFICASSQVCVIWTCWGMVQKGRGAQNKVVRLVVDGKQRIVANQYSISLCHFWLRMKGLLPSLRREAENH